jgi:hypothetical protein
MTEMDATYPEERFHQLLLALGLLLCLALYSISDAFILAGPVHPVT